MKKILSLIVLACFLLSLNILAQDNKNTQAKPVTQKKVEMPQSKNAPKFDPTRDSDKDLKDAIAIAKTNHKFILLDCGGEWCIWCKRLDIFLYDNEELNKMLMDRFNVVKVNYSQDNKNEKFLSNYPKIPGYPHFFILDPQGKLIMSVDTSYLEDGKSSYNIDNIKKFFALIDNLKDFYTRK